MKTATKSIIHCTKIGVLVGMAWVQLSCGSKVDAQGEAIADSISFADAHWQVDSLDGLYLKRCHWPHPGLMGAAQHICLVEIPPQSKRQLAFAHSSQPQPVSAFALQTEAAVAINGSFFDMDKGHPICYLRIAGTPMGENTPSATDSVRRKYYQHAVLTLHDGRPHLTIPDSNRRWEENLTDADVMTAGPMLIWQGQRVPQRDDRTFVTHRHNRTALGLRPDGTVILLVADGRFRQQAEGFSLTDLERVMQWLGCDEAINLDGGGSTTLYVAEKGGVVNYPSDNNQYDHHGERPVSNAIIVK